MSSKMSYAHKLLDPLFLTHFAFCITSTFEPQRGFTKNGAMQTNAATRANQRQRFQQHMAPIKVRVHPAVAILLAVGKGLTKKKDEPPKKSVSVIEKVEMLMLVCKVKMLGER